MPESNASLPSWRGSVACRRRGAARRDLLQHFSTRGQDACHRYVPIGGDFLFRKLRRGAGEFAGIELRDDPVEHRGQLSVYLRLNNIPVPSIYGPSADEGM